MSITALLPLASLALKLGGALLSSHTESPKAAIRPESNERALAPTLQGLFRRLGASDPNDEGQQGAIEQFMTQLMAGLKNLAPEQSLQGAVGTLQQQLENGSAGADGEALQQAYTSLKNQLNLSPADLGAFLDTFATTLPRGRGEGVGGLLATRA